LPSLLPFLQLSLYIRGRVPAAAGSAIPPYHLRQRACANMQARHKCLASSHKLCAPPVCVRTRTGRRTCCHTLCHRRAPLRLSMHRYTDAPNRAKALHLWPSPPPGAEPRAARARCRAVSARDKPPASSAWGVYAPFSPPCPAIWAWATEIAQALLTIHARRSAPGSSLLTAQHPALCLSVVSSPNFRLTHFVVKSHVVGCQVATLVKGVGRL